MTYSRRYISMVAVLSLVWMGLGADVFAQYFSFGKNKVQYDAQQWRFLQTANFDVYYYGEAKPLAVFAARAAEEAHARLSESLTTDPDDRVPILVYQGHQTFANTNAVDLPDYAEGIGGVTELFKNRIAVPFTGSYRNFERVVQHEVVHALVNESFYGGSVQSILRNNIRMRLPLWFEEGLAEYVASGWDAEADMYMREALLENRLTSPASAHGFMAYKGGQSVWDYLAQQYGQEAVSQLLGDLRITRSVEQSVETATGLSLNGLVERWHQSLREVHYPEVAVRQEMHDLATPVITRSQGAYHASPALSPQGDRIAYVTLRGGFFDVYVAEAQSGEAMHRVVEGQTSAMFESLRLQSPGLTWSSDGTQLAVAVTSGSTEAIAVVEVESGEIEHYRLNTVDQVNALDWSPNGQYIALSASAGAQGDVYVLELATQNLVNVTDDVYSDHEPAWHPSGNRLVFHSDRGSQLDLGERRAADENMEEYRPGTFDLYEVEIESRQVTRLTHGRGWNNRSGEYSADGEDVLYISNRNGIDNLYRVNRRTYAVQAISDVLHGVMQFSLSSDGQRAAVSSLEEGAPSIYLMRRPFSERIDRPVPSPTVWAWRARPEVEVAPSLDLAAEHRISRNPFLRAASEGRLYADEIGQGDTLASADTVDYGGIRIDLNDREADDAGQSNNSADDSTDVLAEARDEEGNYTDQSYRLLFSPDLIYGATGFDALYGVQGVAQMRFSDMMGNHRINISTNLLLDLRNADYSFSYHYLARRTDWSVTGYHAARLLPDYQARTYFRFRRYGASLRASYPFDKFHRVELDAGVVGASQADIGDPSAPLNEQVLFNPAITFTRDVVAPGRLTPSGGHRLAISLSGGWGEKRMATLLADGRAYIAFDSDARYTLALRGTGGTSVGELRQLFFTSGVQNWLNRSFDPSEGFPISSASDFIFATPVMPLRGHGFNTRSGAHFGMVNVELRFPLDRTLGSGLLSFLPLQNLSGTAFTDAAAIWDGRAAGDRVRLVHTNEQGDRVFDDLLTGAGFGVRSLVLGYPVRLDVAWPFDGQRFGSHQWYLSVGLDF